MWSLKVAMALLKRAVKGLNKKKQRDIMSNQASVQTMDRFQGVCHGLLSMVEDQCTGLAMTAQTSFPGINNTKSMNQAEVDHLMSGLQGAARLALKLVNKLMQNSKHKKSFCKRSTDEDMILLKDRAFEIINIMKDAGVLLPRMQTR
jgi:hypothetical protein